ncbi:hypothetical protein ACFX13_002454 [Malus domestica]
MLTPSCNPALRTQTNSNESTPSSSRPASRSRTACNPNLTYDHMLPSISLECKRVVFLLQRANISNLIGVQGAVNIQGEDQKKLDLVSNGCFLFLSLQGWWLCNGSAVTVRGSEHAVAAQSAVKLLRSWGVQRSKQTCANMKQQALQSFVKAGKALNAHIYLPASSIFGEKTKTYSFSLASYPNPDDKIKTTRFKDQADDTQGRAMLHELQTDSVGTSSLRHGHEEHLFEKAPTTLDEREVRGRADDVAVA